MYCTFQGCWKSDHRCLLPNQGSVVQFSHTGPLASPDVADQFSPDTLLSLSPLTHQSKCSWSPSLSLQGLLLLLVAVLNIPVQRGLSHLWLAGWHDPDGNTKTWWKSPGVDSLLSSQWHKLFLSVSISALWVRFTGKILSFSCSSWTSWPSLIPYSSVQFVIALNSQ